MHMADALLSPAVGTIMWGASVGAIGYSAAKLRKSGLGEKKVPVMAVAGAFVFAAQMINFTIPMTGSSGHIGGGMLLAGLLGGYPAFLTIAAVLIIQCLFFADGGLLALGCNIFNMGVIPCLLVYPLLIKPILKKGITAKKIWVASILGCIIGLQLGAFSVVLETTASGISKLSFTSFVALMQPIHLAIGAVEGIITAGVLCFVKTLRPELLESSINESSLSSVSVKKTVIVLAVLAVVTGAGLSYFASSYPDGLEWSIEKITGSTELESKDDTVNNAGKVIDKTAIMPDYDYKSASEDGSATGTAVAGIVGAGMTFILAGATGFMIVKIKKRKKERAAVND